MLFGLTFTLHVEVIEDSNPARAVIVASPAFSAVTITELSLPDSKLAISDYLFPKRPVSS